jgi:hypothetical protein
MVRSLLSVKIPQVHYLCESVETQLVLISPGKIILELRVAILLCPKLNFDHA